jgi:tetratricopeptide (TPR) repeat protein
MATASSPDMHVAVLPMRSIGTDSLAMSSFADGFFEYLTSELVELERFRDNLIIESTDQIRKANVTTAEQASRYLNVDRIFQPTLWVEGAKWNFILTLVDAKTNHTLGSKRILGHGSDYGLLQDSTIMLAVDLLRVELTPEQIRTLRIDKTADSRAYVYYVQGLNYLRQYQSLKNLDIADTLFAKAITEDPAYALAHAALGETYWRMYENTRDTQYIARALRFGRRGVALGPELSATRTALGLIYNGTGNTQSAVAEFEQAAEIDPKNQNAFLGLAKTYERGRRYALAESTYRRAIAMNPSYWGGYNELGKFYVSRQQYGSAIGQFEKVVELTPDNYRGYNNIGACFLYLNRKAEAQGAFQRALDRERSYMLYSNIGAGFYMQGYFEEAVRYYEESVAMNPNDYAVWGNLANAYQHVPSLRGKVKETLLRAIAIAKGELAARPGDKNILILLAGYYSDIGDRENSLGYGTRAFDPTDGEILYRLACVYEKVGERSKALSTLRLSLSNGYPLSAVEGEDDLMPLRTDKRYREMVNDMKRGE